MSRRLILMRHAHRGPLARYDFGRNCPITERGRYEAYAVAMGFREAPSLWVHSPSRRCRESAEALRSAVAFVSGASAMPPLRSSEALWPTWPQSEASLGPSAAIRRLLSRPEGPRGLVRSELARIEYLLGLPASGSVLAVTHDLVLAGMLRGLSGEGMTRVSWPAFLSQLSVESDGDGWRLTAGNREWLLNARGRVLPGLGPLDAA